jgi:hypothetical protein
MLEDFGIELRGILFQVMLGATPNITCVSVGFLDPTVVGNLSALFTLLFNETIIFIYRIKKG